MAELQQPEFVFMDGKLVPWKDAKLHVGCEALVRGLNVYEGLKGYWQRDGHFTTFSRSGVGATWLAGRPSSFEAASSHV